MLAVIKHVLDDNNFVFRQRSAPARDARNTAQLLRETLNSISPASCPPAAQS